MDIVDLNKTFRKNKLNLFTLRDVINLFPSEKEKAIKNNLTRWISKGYCIRLRKNLYEFIEQGSEKVIPDLYIANRLYVPSYVSLETALSFYSIIPDIAAAVTSISVRATRIFKNKYGAFFYRTCRNNAYIGYKLMIYDGFKVNIADKEKALVDFIYYNMRSGGTLDFKEQRFNKNILKKINWKKAFYYASLFNKKTIKVLEQCKEFVLC